MKVIKKGKPYRIHKCSKCKTIYAYHIGDSKKPLSNLIYCPECDDYLDIHIFDKKLSKEQYESIKVVE